MNTINDFIVTDIWRMLPTDRSHVSQPYYVEIIQVSEGGIVTNIPGKHKLFITKFGDSPNWDYHIKRMEYVGTSKDFGHLLSNQSFI